jgi:hypothetical protein
MPIASSRFTTIISRAHRPRLRDLSPLNPSTTLVFASRLAMHAPTSSDWKHSPAKETVPAYSIYTKPIVRSQQDDRDYRLIRLENGLRAMIVHDPNTDKAAASLDVAVGHLYDPVSVLPHLLPYMLSN